MLEKGLQSKRRALKALNPEMDDESITLLLEEITKESDTDLDKLVESLKNTEE